MTWVVEPIGHDEAVRLRMAVLRPGQPQDASRYVGEEHGFSMGARQDGRLIGCATFFPQAFPGPGEEDGPLDALVPEGIGELLAWRLRGMATVPELRSSGIGSEVLTAGLDGVRARGGDLVWCNGRTQAMAFYARHGFATIGSEFLSGGTMKVPHYRAWVRLAP